MWVVEERVQGRVEHRMAFDYRAQAFNYANQLVTMVWHGPSVFMRGAKRWRSLDGQVEIEVKHVSDVAHLF